MTFRWRSAATGDATGRGFGRADDREAEFVEGGAVLLGGHLFVGLFMVACFGKLGAEEVALGLQCGDFVKSWSWVVAPVSVSRICRADARVVLSTRQRLVIWCQLWAS